MSGGGGASPQYLADTNVLSEPLRPRPSQRLMEQLRRHWASIATCAPVWNELLFGCYRLPPSARRRKLERYLHHVLAPALPILPYDAAAAEWHAAERARLSLAGVTRPYVDAQIAAIARVNDLVLVTANVADFADMQGLRVEDWR